MSFVQGVKLDPLMEPLDPTSCHPQVVNKLKNLKWLPPLLEKLEPSRASVIQHYQKKKERHVSYSQVPSFQRDTFPSNEIRSSEMLKNYFRANPNSTLFHKDQTCALEWEHKRIRTRGLPSKTGLNLHQSGESLKKLLHQVHFDKFIKDWDLEKILERYKDETEKGDMLKQFQQGGLTPPSKQKDQPDVERDAEGHHVDKSMETEASLSDFLQNLHIGNLHKTKYYIEKRQLWRSRRYKIPLDQKMDVHMDDKEEDYVFGKPQELDADTVEEYYKAFKDLVQLGKALKEKHKLSEEECRFFDSVSRGVIQEEPRQETKKSNEDKENVVVKEIIKETTQQVISENTAQKWHKEFIKLKVKHRDKLLKAIKLRKAERAAILRNPESFKKVISMIFDDLGNYIRDTSPNPRWQIASFTPLWNEKEDNEGLDNVQQEISLTPGANSKNLTPMLYSPALSTPLDPSHHANGIINFPRRSTVFSQLSQHSQHSQFSSRRVSNKTPLGGSGVVLLGNLTKQMKVPQATTIASNPIQQPSSSTPTSIGGPSFSSAPPIPIVAPVLKATQWHSEQSSEAEKPSQAFVEVGEVGKQLASNQSSEAEVNKIPSLESSIATPATSEQQSKSLSSSLKTLSERGSSANGAQSVKSARKGKVVNFSAVLQEKIFEVEESET